MLMLLLLLMVLLLFLHSFLAAATMALKNASENLSYSTVMYTYSSYVHVHVCDVIVSIV